MRARRDFWMRFRVMRRREWKVKSLRICEYLTATDLKNELAAKKELTPEIEAKLVDVIKKFNGVTQVGKKAAV